MKPQSETSAVPKRLICILGMHRSGTSCLTGSLQQHGLELAEHSTWNLHNKRGNRENSVVVAFHEELLEDNGGSWHSPPKKLIWQDKHYQQAEKILADHAEFPLWGFKDPRMLMAIDGWRTLAPNIEFVGIYRHPIAVAQSISKRGSGILSFDKGLDIWYRYNRFLLTAYKHKPFPLMSFDWSQEMFQRQLAIIVKELELPNQNPGKTFFTEQLINNSAADNKQRLPWKVRRLYKKLQSIHQNER